MSDNNNNGPAKDKTDKIEWIGIDGLLVLGYFVLVAIMFCSIYFKIDVLTGYVFPIILLLIVLFVTINYARTLGGFIRMQNQQAKNAFVSEVVEEIASEEAGKMADNQPEKEE